MIMVDWALEKCARKSDRESRNGDTTAPNPVEAHSGSVVNDEPLLVHAR